MPPVAASGLLELFLPHPPSGVPGGSGVGCSPVGTGTLNNRISGVVAEAISESLLSATQKCTAGSAIQISDAEKIWIRTYWMKVQLHVGLPCAKQHQPEPDVHCHIADAH